MKLFDPEKTKKIKSLLALRADFRDKSWFEEFFSTVVGAEFWGCSSKVLRAEDGFPYIALFTEKRDDTPEQLSIADILPIATENGFGAVINPHKIQPDWVFTYGQLWSLREFGSFVVKQDEVQDFEIPEDEDGIFVAEPSEEIFPLYARVSIKRFLLKFFKIADPQVLLLIDPREEPNSSFVFSVFEEDFAQRDDFEAIMMSIDWHLLPHFGLRAVPKNSELAENFSVF